VLEVRVLGGLSAAVDGRPVELPADARARELLARLALSPGPHPRSLLAGRLRPDVPEESARKSLRNALYELRRALGESAADALVADGDRVGLAESASVDLWEFQRHLAAGELEAAAEVGRGELLAGFDGDWAIQAREEHAAELARLLGSLAEQAEEAGDLTAAVGWARRRLEVEPLAEAAHRELIRLLALDGDRPAALAAARAMGERLRSELGIPPSAATRALVEDVRRGRVAQPTAAADASAPPLPPVLAAAEHPEGRAAVIARLEQAWQQAAAGAPRVALVTGEPGIGKTTLAGELARRAHAQGGAVLLGRSDESALVPFQPWIEAIERLLEALPDGEADHWLSAHDGALARLLPTRSAAEAPPGGPRERYLAFELVRGLLEDVAGRWPVLLVLDDVHWADADSLFLLRHLARSGSRARLLALLCLRPAELAPGVADTLAELRREGPLVHVELVGLDDDAVAALLARRTGESDPESARRLRARSGGNPFFLDELVREAAEAGGEIDGPPAGVREVIARRLARLDDSTLRTLDAAALLGMEFDVPTLARVEERPVVEVLEALDGAIEAALVTDTDRPGRYAFVHALVDETIVAALPASRRARLHLQIAEVLAELHETGAVRAGEVARHLRGAGALAAPERHAQWELAAAREATAALAPAEAASHLEAALAARPGAPEPERGDMLIALGHAHDRAGRRERARAAFADAADLARAASDPDRLARAALGHGGPAVVIAAADPASVRLLEEALAATPTDELATSARLLARLSVELYYPDRDRARELSALAVERARAAGDQGALAAALNARRVALWSPHHSDERLATAGDMIAAAEAADDREALLQGRNWRVVDLLELGRVEEAAAEVDAYEELADAVGLPLFRWYVPMWRGTLALLAGRWDEAHELSEHALALGRQADDPNAPLFVGIQRETSQAVRWLFGEIDVGRLAEGGTGTPAEAGWRMHLALTHAQLGATDEARRLVARLGSEPLPLDANWHAACVLGEAAVYVGDRDVGAALYETLEPHARLFPVLARAVGCLGSNEYYVGLLAGLLGRRDEAVARLRRAIEEDDRAGAGPHAATALLRLGEALAESGEHDQARDALQQAAARADALGMPALVAAVERQRAATVG
jgi:DNA-binding SARP family transcriptional activator/tetratricopeptide (TPR) repeat protein